MFQHANPVEVPYKAGFRILILTECHKEAHKGNAIGHHPPHALLDSLAESGVFERWGDYRGGEGGRVYRGRRFEVFAGGFHSFDHIPAVSA